MTRVIALAALVMTLVPAGAAATPTANGKAKLRLVQGAALVVRGTQFVPGERVRVTVETERTLSKRTTANGNGSFVVRFDVFLDRCNSATTATAVGSRGSRARVKLPQRMCPPRL